MNVMTRRHSNNTKGARVESTCVVLSNRMRLKSIYNPMPLGQQKHVSFNKECPRGAAEERTLWKASDAAMLAAAAQIFAPSDDKPKSVNLFSGHFDSFAATRFSQLLAMFLVGKGRQRSFGGEKNEQ